MSVAVDNNCIVNVLRIKGKKNSAWLVKVNRTGQAIYGRNFAS